MKTSIRNQLLTSSVIFAALVGPAYAAPVLDASAPLTGATISTVGKITTINQTANKVDIKYTDFSSAADESIRFVQPNANAIAINRVTSGKQSLLLGKLDANGRLVIINDAGVVFGAGSQTNVGALTASTAKNFTLNSNGTYTATDFSGNQLAVHGSIKTADGYVFLVGKDVNLSATSNINIGKGTLDVEAGAKTYEIDLSGNGKINYTDKLDSGKIQVRGAVDAKGGNVIIQTQASNIANAALNISGVVDVTSLGGAPGSIKIASDGDINIRTKLTAGNGSVALDAGRDVNLYGLDASGNTVNVTAKGDINSFHANKLTSTGDTNLKGSVRSDYSSSLLVTAGKDLNLTGNGHGEFVLNDGRVTLNAAGNTTLKDANFSTGYVGISGQGISISGDTKGIATRLYTSSTGDTNITGNLDTLGGNAFIYSGKDINLTNLTAKGGDLVLTAAGHDTISNSTLSNHLTTINSTGDAKITDSTINSNLESYTKNLDITNTTDATIHSNIAARNGGTVNISTDKNLTVSGATLDSGTGKINLSATGNATITDTNITGKSTGLDVKGDLSIKNLTTSGSFSAHPINNTNVIGKITVKDGDFTVYGSTGLLNINNATIDAGSGELYFGNSGKVAINNTTFLANKSTSVIDPIVFNSFAGNITLNNITLNTPNIYFGAFGGSVILPANLNTNNGNITLYSSDALGFGKVNAGTGTISLETEVDLDFAKSIANFTAANVELITPKTVNLTGAINFGPSNYSIISAGDVNVSNATLTANGLLLSAIGGGVDTDLTNRKGNVNLTNSTINGTTVTLNTQSDETSGNIYLNSSKVNGSTVNLATYNGISSSGTSSITSTGDVNIDSLVFGKDGTLDIKAGKDLNMTIERDYDLSNAHGTVNLTAGNDANLNAAKVLARTVNLKTGRDLNVKGQFSVYNDADDAAPSGSINIITGGNINLKDTGNDDNYDSYITSIFALKDLKITTNGDIVDQTTPAIHKDYGIYPMISAEEGDVTVNTKGAITLNAGTIQAEGDLTVNTGKSLTAIQLVSFDGELSVKTAGDLNAGASAGNDLSLTVGGNFNGGFETNEEAVVNVTGNINIDSDNSIRNYEDKTVTINAGKDFTDASGFTTVGDLKIYAKGNLKLSGESYGTNISLKADQNLDISDTTLSGDVITATSGTNTTFKNVNTTALNSTSGGDTNITGDLVASSGAINIKAAKAINITSAAVDAGYDTTTFTSGTNMAITDTDIIGTTVIAKATKDLTLTNVTSEADTFTTTAGGKIIKK